MPTWDRRLKFEDRNTGQRGYTMWSRSDPQNFLEKCPYSPRRKTAEGRAIKMAGSPQRMAGLVSRNYLSENHDDGSP